MRASIRRPMNMLTFDAKLRLRHISWVVWLLTCLSMACTIEVLMPGEGVERAPIPDAGGSGPGGVDEPVDQDPNAGNNFVFRITTISPAFGPAEGGTRVTIVGELFTEPVQVFVGGVAATDVVFKGETTISADVPAQNPGPADVVVVRGDGKQTTLKGGFLYLADIRISGVQPPVGEWLGGTPITVTGQGFSGDTVVLVNGREGIGTKVVDDQTVVTLTPQGTEGLADVFVSNANGFARLRDGFRYFSRPKLHSVWPLAGKTSGGELVHIMGEGLSDVTEVTINNQPATIAAVWGDDTVSVVSPPGELGPADLFLSIGSTSVYLPNGYAYVNNPAADGETGVWVMSPQSGPQKGGTEVRALVVGAPDMNSVDVRVGGEAATNVVWNPTTGVLVFNTPASTEGTVPVAFRFGEDKVYAPVEFHYLPDLYVGGIVASEGPQPGGTNITVVGSGFANGVEIRVGALPATDVTVVSPTELVAVTSPGTAGWVDVVVRSSDVVASLADGFQYLPDKPAVYAFKPTRGAVAGGTFVRIYGAGFAAVPKPKVFFGALPAANVVVHSSTLMTVYAPPGDLGVVDVTVLAPSLKRTFPQAYEYFEPKSNYGGTWGDPVDESIHVTVLEASSGDPVDGAFVMLGATSETPYQHWTDANGQTTFSGPGLLGRQTVTAAKTGYTTASILSFDATNVTLYLVPYQPPSGGGGTPLQPGTVSGRVFGLGKYVIVPPGKCSDLVDDVLLYCKPCAQSSDCGAAGTCMPVGDQGTHCTTECVHDAECPQGYVCASAVGGGAYCQPTAGKKEARCQTSTSDLFASVPDAGPKKVAEVGSNGVATYAITSRLGDVAVVCYGGYVENVTNRFVPTVMGVLRHVFVTPDTLLPDQDVELNIPLSRSVEVRLDNPPVLSSGPNVVDLDVFLVLGTDGVIPMGGDSGISPDMTFRVDRLPASLSGPLYDATYTFYAGSYTKQKWGLPYSISQHRDIVDTGDSAVYEWLDVAFEPVPFGAPEDLRAVSGGVGPRRFAVGDGGTVLHHDGEQWMKQPSPTKKNLKAVAAYSDSIAYAAGEDGAMLRFDGNMWSVDPIATTKDLRSISVFGPDEAVAVGWFGVWERTSGGWQPFSGAPSLDAHAVWANSAEDWWMGGAYGQLWHYQDGEWTSYSAPKPVQIRGLWGLGNEFRFAVGAEGTVLRFDGTQWLQMANVPTDRTLYGISGRIRDGQLELFVVGDGGVMLRFDGSHWTSVSPGNSGTQIGGVWADPLNDDVIAVGSRSLFLGPFMRVPAVIKQDKEVSLQSGPVTFDIMAPLGTPPHFRYAQLLLGNGTPLWTVVLDGAATQMVLPNLLEITNIDALPAGPKRLRLYSIFKEGFDIDHYDGFDFRMSEWRAWSLIDESFQ